MAKILVPDTSLIAPPGAPATFHYNPPIQGHGVRRPSHRHPAPGSSRAPGDLDPSCDAVGKVLIDFRPRSRSHEAASAVVVQPDDPLPCGEDLGNTGHAPLATGRTRPATGKPSGPDGASPHPPGTDAELFMTPADTLSCRRQPNPENTPTLPCHSRFRPSIRSPIWRSQAPALHYGPRFSRVDSSERRSILPKRGLWPQPSARQLLCRMQRSHGERIYTLHCRVREVIARHV
jgi:hypothetical protein